MPYKRLPSHKPWQVNLYDKHHNYVDNAGCFVTEGEACRLYDGLKHFADCCGQIIKVEYRGQSLQPIANNPIRRKTK